MSVLEVASNRLVAELSAARTQSDILFSTLTPEAMYRRPIAERHRVIFYLGHLDGFDSIQICREGLRLTSSDSALDDLFQAGIDPDAGHLPKDTASDWPAIDQVQRLCGALPKECRREFGASARGNDPHGARAPADASRNAGLHVSQFSARLENLSGTEPARVYGGRGSQATNGARYRPAK